MPPVIIEIKGVDNASAAFAKVEQAAAKTGTTLTSGFGKATEASTQFTKSTTQAETASDNLSKSAQRVESSFGSSVKSALAFGTAAIGIASVGGALAGVVGSAASFEKELNAISSLGTVSSDRIAKFREELIALPPSLGTTTELAKGLYDTLSANIPEENAIQFLVANSELAKGGLSNLDTAINATTKSMAAFNIPVTEINTVTDVFLQTVVKGQGRLEEMAKAFPIVGSTAAAAGDSFKNSAAAMAVLTQTFKSTETAADGLQALYRSFIQDSAKFGAVGLDVAKVLGEEGIAGASRRLAEITGGSSTKLRTLISDDSAYRAALALTGAQLGNLTETTASYNNITGLAHKASQTNLAGLTANWTTFLNTLERFVQVVAPPVLGIAKDIVGGLTGLAESATKAFIIFRDSDFLKTLTSNFTQFYAVLRDSEFLQGLGTSFSALSTVIFGTNDATGQSVSVFTAIAELFRGNVRPAIDFMVDGWDLLNAANTYITAGFLKLGQYAVDYVVTPFLKMIEVVDKAAKVVGLSGGEFSNVSEDAARLSKDLNEAAKIYAEMADQYVLGTNRVKDSSTEAAKAQQDVAMAAKNAASGLQQAAAATQQATAAAQAASPTEKALVDNLENANRAANDLQQALKNLKPGDSLKAISTKDLELGLGVVITKFKEIETSGVFSSTQVQKAYQDAAKTLQERFGVLPAAFQQTYDAFLEKTRKTAADIGLVFERLGIQTKAAQLKSAEDLSKDIQAVIKSTLGVAEESGKIVRDATGKYSQEAKQSAQEVAKTTQDTVQQTTTTVTDSYAKITTASGKTFTAISDQSASASRDVREQTSASTADLVMKFVESVDKLEKSGIKRIPASFRENAALLGPLAREAGGEIYERFREAVDKINGRIGTIPSIFSAAFSDLIKITAEFGTRGVEALAVQERVFLERAGLIRKDITLSAEAKEGNKAFEYSMDGLSEKSRIAGHAINGLGQEVNKYGNEVKSTAKEQDLFTAQLVGFTTKFGETREALLKQAAEFRKTAAEAQQLADRSGLTEPGNAEAFRDQLRRTSKEGLDIITEKLKDLGYNLDGSKIAQDKLSESTETLGGKTTETASAIGNLSAMNQQSSTSASTHASSLQAVSTVAESTTVTVRDHAKALGEVDIGLVQANAMYDQFILANQGAGAELERISALLDKGTTPALQAASVAVQEYNRFALANGGQQIDLNTEITAALKDQQTQLQGLEAEARTLGDVHSIEDAKHLESLNAQIAKLQEFAQVQKDFLQGTVQGFADIASAAQNPLPSPTLGAPTVTTVGGGGGLSDFVGRIGATGSGGGGTGGGITAVTVIPGGRNVEEERQRILAGTRPTLRRFQGGGFVTGGGGEDSVEARLTPGELVITPEDVPQVLRMLRGASSRGSNAQKIVYAPISVTVQVMSPRTRSEAQHIVTELTPAIQEAIDRNQLRVG